MERVTQTQNDLLLSGFEMVYRDHLRHDLSSEHMEHVTEVLNELAKNCVDAGLGYKIATIRENCIMEQKLLDLKTAYDIGGIDT